MQRFLAKPWYDEELLAVVREGLERCRLIRENRRLTAEVSEKNRQLEEWNAGLKQRVLQQTAALRKRLEENRQEERASGDISDAVLGMLIDLLDSRHQRLGNHCRTVAALAASMTETLGIPREQHGEIRMAACLHDLGLICLADRYLASKNGMLATEEYLTHPVRGQQLLDLSDRLRKIGRIIRHHHERFDGAGFPDGLKGAGIPLGARIIHLASAIDHNYLPEEGPSALYTVAQKIRAGMGSHFDPDLAPAAMKALQEVLGGAKCFV